VKAERLKAAPDEKLPAQGASDLDCVCPVPAHDRAPQTAAGLIAVLGLELQPKRFHSRPHKFMRPPSLLAPLS
jgi:hypothetical protein